MPTTTYKVLAQSAPSATSNTDIYTVGAGKQTVISTIVIANRSATAATYRIAIRPDGTALANTHYLAFDTPIAGSDSITLTLGITMDASDVVTVYGSSANFTFSLFGAEIS
jgi:hypothetical protein